MKPEPFSISIDQPSLDELHQRLRHTRWPDEPSDAGWSMGTNLAFMRKMVEYWVSGYDWRAQERALNELAQFRAQVAGEDFHFFHVRAADRAAVPVLLLHGWPDSNFRFAKAIPELAETAGGPAFHVVAPSLPGFGFSTHRAMNTTETAALLVQLMKGLGYDRFLVAGGDVGAILALTIADLEPRSLLGMHLTDVGYPDGNTDFASLTPEEQAFAGFIQGWWMREGAFNMVQSTKPQSLAFGLNDSPAGLAAWIMSVVASGTEDKLDDRFTLDELLTNIMLYWVTETAASSFRNYLENARAMYGNPNAARPAPPTVPAAVAHMPWDAPLPRAWAERKVNVQQFSEMPRGGHFGAWEIPDAYANDVKQFARLLKV